MAERGRTPRPKLQYGPQRTPGIQGITPGAPGTVTPPQTLHRPRPGFRAFMRGMGGQNVDSWRMRAQAAESVGRRLYAPDVYLGRGGLRSIGPQQDLLPSRRRKPVG